LPESSERTSRRIALERPEEVIVEAWLSRAPRRLAQQYIDAQLPPDA